LIRKLLSKSSVRWFLVGSATFLIDTGLFLLAFYLTNIVILSNLLSGSVATAFNYFSHYHWSFASDRQHKQSTLIYLTFFFIFLTFGTTLVTTLVNSGVEPAFAKVGSALITAPISFFIMKFITFKRSQHVQ
jgi:putative flippase GtrA